MSDRRALVVGIDRYAVKGLKDLRSCAEGAAAIAKLLATHYDQSQNWATIDVLIDENEPVTVASFDAALDRLLDDPTDDTDLLFYFSGHAIQQKRTPASLVAFDGTVLSLSDWLSELTTVSSKLRSFTIILDCCFSGSVANIRSINGDLFSVVPEKTTILTACRGDDEAQEITFQFGSGQLRTESLFTAQVVRGLAGTAADALGNVTALGLFSQVVAGAAATTFKFRNDLQPQLPTFKSNIDNPVILRQTKPAVELKRLLKITELFTDPDARIRLNMSHEGLTKDRWKELAAGWQDGDPGKVAVFEKSSGANFRGDENRKPFSGSAEQKAVDHLKLYRNAGLIEAEGDRDQYWLMENEGQVWLSELGKYYWHLVDSRMLIKNQPQERVLTVGITGHMNISGETRKAVAAAIAAELVQLKQPFEGLTALAPGADQVFAWLVHATGGDVVFVQPSRDIESTIPEANGEDFASVRRIAQRTILMRHLNASDQAYFDAGAYISDNVDLLLAVWDGNPSAGLGGTGSIVERRQAAGRPIKIIWPRGAVRIEP